MKIGYVYSITCSITGKIYIGSTINISKRWNTYKSLNCKLQVKLYRSLLKYGVNNHLFEILWSGNEIDRLKYEYLIGTYYEVLNRGLNCKLPKYNEDTICIGKTTRIKMSISQTGKVLSQDTKDKIGEFSKNRKYSQETIEKRRAKTTGKKRTQEQKDRIKVGMIGKRIVTDETRKKLSNSSKNRVVSQETKDKIRMSRLKTELLKKTNEYQR